MKRVDAASMLWAALSAIVVLFLTACSGSDQRTPPPDVVPYVSEATTFTVHALGDGAVLEIRLGYDGRQPLRVHHVRLNLPSGLSGEFLGFADCSRGCVGGAPATPSNVAQAERAVTSKDSIVFPSARNPGDKGNNVVVTAEIVLRLATDAAVKSISSGECVTVPSLSMQSGSSTFRVELFAGGWVAALAGESGCVSL